MDTRLFAVALASLLLAAVAGGCSRTDGSDLASALRRRDASKEASSPVPSVVGMKPSEAATRLAAAGYQAAFFGVGAHVSPDAPSAEATIAAQDPRAGQGGGRKWTGRLAPGTVAVVLSGDRVMRNGQTMGLAWFPHADAVKELGAQICFECHESHECAACHVRVLEHTAKPSGKDLRGLMKFALAARGQGSKLRAVRNLGKNAFRVEIEVMAKDRRAVIDAGIAEGPDVLREAFASEPRPGRVTVVWYGKGVAEPSLEMGLSSSAADHLAWQYVDPSNIKAVVEEFREY